jgi:hypothetical protein
MSSRNVISVWFGWLLIIIIRIIIIRKIRKV